jgi:hypothetical protein
VEAAFYTVSDADYFIGTVALLNSIRGVGHDEQFFVSDCGLDEPQRQFLEPLATLVDASLHEAPHHAKLRAPLGHEADVMILLDSDILVMRRLDELIERAERGSIVAFADPLADRFDLRWGSLLGLEDLDRGTYVNAGALVVPRQLAGPVFARVLAAQEVVDLEQTRLGYGTTTDPFYFVDQDVWNAVLASRVGAGKLDVLPNRLAPHPPFRGLRSSVEGDRYMYGNGDAPFMLHHVRAKPWLRRTRRNLYSQLLPQFLLKPGLPLRLEPRELPLRLRSGPLAALARLYSDAVAAARLLRGRLGIRRRLSAWLSDKRGRKDQSEASVERRALS